MPLPETDYAWENYQLLREAETVHQLSTALSTRQLKDSGSLCIKPLEFSESISGMSSSCFAYFLSQDFSSYEVAILE